MADHATICANWAPGKKLCMRSGVLACKDCLLVAYCGTDCQKTHWKVHRVDCKSFLRSHTWQPDWFLQRRSPVFLHSPDEDDSPLVKRAGRLFWGNVPAIDVLNLSQNEGLADQRPFNLLFAPSGGLRNVVKTIADLPVTSTNPLEITLNDADFDIAARNAIILLIAYFADKIEDAIDCIIHVWYSTLIRKCDLMFLRKKILPQIQAVCDELSTHQNPAVWQLWMMGNAELGIELPKESWLALRDLLEIPSSLTAERATAIRQNVTLARHNQDLQDRDRLYQSPSHRLAHARFREDGLLLPFGARRNEFNHPNPTFFQTADSWPMSDNFGPLNEWTQKDVHDTSSGPATADIYGKLFNYLRVVIGKFVRRVQSDHGIFVRLFHIKKFDHFVPKMLNVRFDRIEVSHIADDGYGQLGMPYVLEKMVPLLKCPSDNPHATLVTVLAMAVRDNITDEERFSHSGPYGSAAYLIREYLSLPVPTSIEDPNAIKIMYAMDRVVNHDPAIKRYLKKVGVFQKAHEVGARIKKEHTIVERWPFKLYLRPGQPGAQEEFDRLVGGGLSSLVGYLEWQKFRKSEDSKE